MIVLVAADGEMTFVSPADFARLDVCELAARCTWCWSIAEAFALSRARRAR